MKRLAMLFLLFPLIASAQFATLRQMELVNWQGPYTLHAANNPDLLVECVERHDINPMQLLGFDSVVSPCYGQLGLTNHTCSIWQFWAPNDFAKVNSQQSCISDYYSRTVNATSANGGQSIGPVEFILAPELPVGTPVWVDIDPSSSWTHDANVDDELSNGVPGQAQGSFRLIIRYPGQDTALVSWHSVTTSAPDGREFTIEMPGSTATGAEVWRFPAKAGDRISVEVQNAIHVKTRGGSTGSFAEVIQGLSISIATRTYP